MGYPSTPFENLDEDAQDILLNGTGSTEINFRFESERGSIYQSRKPWKEYFLDLRDS